MKGLGARPRPAAIFHDTFSVTLQRACSRGLSMPSNRLCWSYRTPTTTLQRSFPDHVYSANIPRNPFLTLYPVLEV